jgi:hypothetical protein
MSRRWLIGIGAALGGVVFVVLAGYLGLVWWTSSRVPLDTTVAGVPIGGMERTEARDAVEAWATQAESTPIQVDILGE